ncbi:MAG: glycosyltransferase family 4 protein [Planctomycetes bacterium]|nr:glycosyltransferase family 4 protein [Planctomycetota bacterium]
MNILTTTLCYPTPGHPDQGVFVQRRAEALARRPGVSLSVVSPQPWCPLLRHCERIEPQSEPLSAMYPRLFSIPMLGWATDGAAYARMLSRVVARRRRAGLPPVDLIDAHFVYPEGVGAWLAGRRLGIPVVVTVRGKIVRLSRRAIRRMQIAAMLRGVDARIAVSRSLVGWVHRVGGGDLNVDVVPNGIRPDVYRLVDRQWARIALGWHHTAKYVLAVGHLQRLKGFDRLVAVLPALREALGDVRLTLVGSRRGEWWFARKVRRMIERCNLEAGTTCIDFVGPVGSEQLNLLYNAADVMVNSSRSEGWNNAISEALGAGTPVVATNVGGNPEQIRSGELGIVVPDGDMDALAGALRSALVRSWNRPRIASLCGTRTWTHVAEEVHAVFDRVLAARVPSVGLQPSSDVDNSATMMEAAT